MSEARCVHGMDSRFCAICNTRSAFGIPRASIGAATLAEILEFLNAAQLRATYDAVGEVLGLPGSPLRARVDADPKATPWIVNDDTSEAIIRTGMELALRMTAWRASRRTPA